MSLPRIIVTRRLPETVEARLRASFATELNVQDRPFDRAQLATALREADGLLCTVSDQLDAALIGAPDRRAGIIANFGVGVNNIDLEAARAGGVVVGNTPGVLTEATADLALALILAATRRLTETEAVLRRGDWAGFSPTGFLGMGLQGKILGILGMGRIGQAVARRASLGFGMRVIYFNRSAAGPFDGFEAEPRPDIRTVLAEADVVSLHVPGGGGGPVVTAELLAAMKSTAYLVNTARGDVIDKAALAAALTEGRIAGAGLDVFVEEPRVPSALLQAPNVTLLPHIGSATLETRTAMGMLAVDNLEAHFAGRPLPARVA